MSLYQQWLNAKETERQAVEERRKIEDDLVALHGIEQREGSATIKADGYVVKVTQRFNRSINADELQEIAAEEGLTAHLSSLFRWKPEINAKAWSSASEDITRPLLGAITTKPGRPSFSITKQQEE